MMPHLRLIGSNGDEITLSPFGRSEFATLRRPRGFGIQSNQIEIVEGAGNGGRYRFTRKGAMDRDVPIGIFGTGRRDVFALQRRLSNLLRDVRGLPAPRLVFPAGDGLEYETEVHLVTQAELEDVAHEKRALWLLTLRSPDPYWTARNAVTLPSLRAATATPLRPKLGNLQVAAAQVLGSLLVENAGDVESAPVWSIRGPLESFTATPQFGRGFSLGEVLDGETITVDTRPGRIPVVDQTGADRYELLGPAPKLFPFPGGTSTVTIDVQNATADTLVRGFYWPRVEVMF